jgi:hypothetical protein
MSDNRLPEYLDQMRQAGSDARTFLDGLNKDDFLADKRTQQAVIMSLIIVGEIATKIMDRFPDFADQLSGLIVHVQGQFLKRKIGPKLTKQAFKPICYFGPRCWTCGSSSPHFAQVAGIGHELCAIAPIGHEHCGERTQP